MPTFTTIALDRLLETGATKSVENSGPNQKPPIPGNSGPNRKPPIPNSNPVSTKNTSVTDRKVICRPILPALYATPEVTPLPDSPSSFSPSPYIINHKRRGPRLSKSFSANDVSRKGAVEEEEANGNAKLAVTKSVDLSEDVSFSFNFPQHNDEKQENHVIDGTIGKEQENGSHGGFVKQLHMNGVHDDEFGISNGEVGSTQSNELVGNNVVLKNVSLNSDRYDDHQDFFDPTESMSAASTSEGDDARIGTPMVEFYDAWEELSSESAQESVHHDTELREIRLSLLMEAEKRKQAEEALNSIRDKWQRISQELVDTGLLLPEDPIDLTEDELANSAKELRQQVDVARFVSLSMGRGIARAEMEKEMEEVTKSKDFEIARLWDSVNYYEAVNREMTQRNQEAIEMARRDRQRKKRRQRWVWGSIAAAITLGTTALVWSYLPSGEGSAAISPEAEDQDDAAE